MGKTVFIGAATAKPQITTIAIGGTWGDTETVTLKIAEKEVVYTLLWHAYRCDSGGWAHGSRRGL